MKVYPRNVTSTKMGKIKFLNKKNTKNLLNKTKYRTLNINYFECLQKTVQNNKTFTFIKYSQFFIIKCTIEFQMTKQVYKYFTKATLIDTKNMINLKFRLLSNDNLQVY